MNVDEYIKQADTIVSNQCERYNALFPRCGVLLSGGIDSSLITTYVLKKFKEPHILSMGTDLSKDKPFVDLVTVHFKCPYEWVFLTESDIAESLPIVTKLLQENGVEPTEMQQALAVGYFLIFKRAKALKIQGIVTGQGPDILFAGYHKYAGMEGKVLEDQIKKDLVLLEIDKKRDGAMANHFGITLMNPYLEEDFVSFSLTVPAALKRKDGIEKYFMREWGKKQGLPKEIVERPKKAFQYSTGLQKKIHKKSK